LLFWVDATKKLLWVDAKISFFDWVPKRAVDLRFTNSRYFVKCIRRSIYCKHTR